jgi:uncharacterized membrane protein YkgB
MRKLWNRIPPLARGLGIVALIAVVVVVLSLEPVLATVGGILRIAFFLAVAFFLFLVWRDRVRGEVELWPQRPRWVFYGGAALIVADLAVFFWPGRTTAGPDALAFLFVLVLAAFSMWRVWRDERTYGL